MKRFFILLFFVFSFVFVNAQFFNKKIDGIEYSSVIPDISGEYKAVEVTRAWGGKKYKGSIVIPSEVSYKGKSYLVTKIGYHAFNGCEKLNSITIPNSVTEIGEGAFAGCSNLTTLVIPNSVTKIGRAAFSKCEQLSSIILSENLTEIAQSAFWGCINLSSITIPKQVNHISSDAFHGCNNLKSITIEEGTRIGSSAIPKETVISYYPKPEPEIFTNPTLWKCSDGQKIYWGEYTLFGKGKAKYQYRQGPNNSRIFDGHFVFLGEDLAAEGDFKDDYQIGHWVFTNSPIGYVEIDFNEKERIVTGEFSHKYDKGFCLAKGKFMRANDGHLYGPHIYGVGQRKNRITYFEYDNKILHLYGKGEYNLDGKEKGKWIYEKDTGVWKKNLTAEYDNNGKLLDCYYIDNSTGDKIKGSIGDVRDFINNNALKNHWEKLNLLLLRSSSDYY